MLTSVTTYRHKCDWCGELSGVVTTEYPPPTPEDWIDDSLHFSQEDVEKLFGRKTSGVAWGKIETHFCSIDHHRQWNKLSKIEKYKHWQEIRYVNVG